MSGPDAADRDRSQAEAGFGPYLFCDYWVSVLGLRSILRPDFLRRGLVSLEHFRKAIDRPLTRLPKLRYYILAFVLVPALFPYKVVYDIMRLLRGRVQKVEHPVDEVMSRYRLGLQRLPGGRVRVTRNDAVLADGLIDPEQVGVEVSLFYPTYKLLIAGVCSVILSIGVLAQLGRFEVIEPVAPYFEWVLFTLMFLALLLIFRDLVTAVLAPLPIFAVRFLLRADTKGELLLAALGFILLYYLFEWFFLPRPLPPTLFLLVNDPGSDLFPWRERHAPYWLEGRRYWVWRFMALAPAELNKFWEKDWERVEVWVRADGERAGMLEWVVYDAHYRELWFRYERLTGPERGAELADRLARELAAGGRVDWVLETDMDYVFHSPFVRGLFLEPAESGRWRAMIRLFRALRVRPRADRYEHYAHRLADLEIDGTEFLADVPEHFRDQALRAIIRLPWDYWRFPLGAAAAPRRFVYQDSNDRPTTAPAAVDGRYQVKQAAGSTGNARE